MATEFVDTEGETESRNIAIGIPYVLVFASSWYAKIWHTWPDNKVSLAFDMNSLVLELIFTHVYLRIMISIFAFIPEILILELSRGSNLS